MEEAFKAMKSGKNQYAPMPGILSLKRAVKNIYKKYYDMDWDENKNVTITAGATEALFSTFMALVETGDEVIMFEPFYDAAPGRCSNGRRLSRNTSPFINRMKIMMIFTLI